MMIVTDELLAAVREALLASTPETEQQIWHKYFFGATDDAGEAYRIDERERMRAAALM
ncbi:hypothetical protein [Sphingomonas sp. T9W2]|uniref:hypothetical protein n=1 Tax=Sphingomonas sp. T9W2 TaxID=3143183 RepID=UPI0031F57175